MYILVLKIVDTKLSVRGKPMLHSRQKLKTKW